VILVYTNTTYFALYVVEVFYLREPEKETLILKIDTTKIKNWPLRYIHCHTNNDVPFHALTIFLDNNFSVRGNEVSNFIKIEN